MCFSFQVFALTAFIALLPLHSRLSRETNRFVDRGRLIRRECCCATSLIVAPSELDVPS